jgi:hypothetical protein
MEFTSVKIAVFKPIPSPSDNTAARVKPRLLASVRNP